MGVEIISVVAGGWSVNEIDQSLIPGYIIGVNDSAYRLPRVDAVVSMDRKWTQGREEWLINAKLPTYLRLGTVPDTLSSRHWVTVYKNNNKTVSFGPTTSHMNGTSSATVALNLAYILWPKTLYLFGFDMCRGPNDEAHWHPDYPWNPKATKQGKLHQWAREFGSVAEEFHRKKIAVFNVSTRSRINVFRKVSPFDVGMERKIAS